jgi:hypothetical protein
MEIGVRRSDLAEAAEQAGDPAGVLIADEPGFVKEGPAVMPRPQTMIKKLHEAEAAQPSRGRWR